MKYIFSCPPHLGCKDSMGLSVKAPGPVVSSCKQGESLTMPIIPPTAPTSGTVNSISEISLEKTEEGILDINWNSGRSAERTKTSPRSAKLSAVNDKHTSQRKNRRSDKLRSEKSLKVFTGKRFCFSLSFPGDRVSFFGFIFFARLKILNQFGVL